MKHHTLTATIRAKENQRMLLRSGSVKPEDLKKIDPVILMRERKLIQQQRQGIIRDQDLVMRQ